MHKAALLDKDVTLIRNLPFNIDPDLIELTPGAADALTLFAQHGYRLIVISNQPGVAFGLFGERDLQLSFHRIQRLLAPLAQIDGFYYCPHHPQGKISRYAVECGCRKPSPGLLFRAAREHRIDLQQSWFIGDILDDVEAGHSAGCRTIMINNGNETEWRVSKRRNADFYACSLIEAAMFACASGPRTSAVEQSEAQISYPPAESLAKAIKRQTQQE